MFNNLRIEQVLNFYSTFTERKLQFLTCIKSKYFY
jgi:hypothetical protein